MYITVDVDLDDVDKDELIEYLENNGYTVTKDKSKEEPENTARTLARDCQSLADYNNTFWRDFLTDVLHVPFMSDTDDILNGVRSLIK